MAQIRTAAARAAAARAARIPSIQPPDAGFDLPVLGLADLLGGEVDGAIRLPPHLLDRLDPLASVDDSEDAGRRHREDEWALPLAELIALATLCAHARPRRIFEFGTYTGGATLVLAMNAPADAELFTLDLAPAARNGHVHGLGVGGFPEFVVGAHLRGHPAASRVRQIFGDSQSFDDAPFRGSIDFVLIDADHTYAFVVRDTERALAMLRPGGMIVWDDYVWSPRFPECAGVTRCVNELARSRPVHRIAGTRLAVYVEGGAQAASFPSALPSSSRSSSMPPFRSP